MSCKGAVGGVGARLLGAEKTVWSVGIGDTVVLRQHWTRKEEMELSIYNSAEEEGRSRKCYEAELNQPAMKEALMM